MDRRGYSQYNQSPSEYVPRSAMATVIAYVDGFNLYHGLHQGYGRRYLWLDLQHLVQRMRPHDQILRVWNGASGSVRVRLAVSRCVGVGFWCQPTSCLRTR